ncbi:MAG: hypothetical protein IKJ68_01665 [Clostridia bacterium]|nr:hypothetical protein [Clostridia bacterium]
MQFYNEIVCSANSEICLSASEIAIGSEILASSKLIYKTASSFDFICGTTL